MAVSNVVDSDTATTDAGNSYRFRIGDVRGDSGTVSVNYEWDRVEGDEGAYLGSVDLVNSAGNVLDSDEIQSGITGPPVSFDGTLSASASPGETLSVVLETDLISDLSFTAPVDLDPDPDPDPDPVEPSVDAACDFDGAEITEGDSVTIPVDVTAGDGDTSTEATVEIEVAGQTASETVTLDPNGSARVEATYEISDPGEYTPEITLS